MEVDNNTKKERMNSVLDSTSILELCFQYLHYKEKTTIISCCCKKWNQLLKTSVPCCKYDQIKMEVHRDISNLKLIQTLQLEETREMSDTIHSLDKLNECKEIRKLDLTGLCAHLDQLYPLYFPKLTILECADRTYYYTDKNRKQISEFVSRHQTIQSLIFRCDSFTQLTYFSSLFFSLRKLTLTVEVIVNKNIEILSKFVYLEDLTITNNFFYSKEKEEREEKENYNKESKFTFPSLIRLSLTNSIHLLPSFDSFSKLEHLKIWNYKKRSVHLKSMEWFSLQTFPSLKTCSLFGCSEHLVDFSFLTTSNCLTELSIRGQKNYESLFHLIKTKPDPFSTLQILTIKCTQELKEKAFSLDFLVHLKHLNYLSIDYHLYMGSNLFSLSDLFYISNLPCLNTLIVNISSTFIDEAKSCRELKGRFNLLLPLKTTLKRCEFTNIYLDETDKEIIKEFSYGKYFQFDYKKYN